ncbi:MAG: helix-turn-helix domain-containing protein [Polyangiaceae bacterium]
MGTRAGGRANFEFFNWVTTTYGIGAVTTDRARVDSFQASVEATPLATSMVVEVAAVPLTLDRSRKDVAISEHDMLTVGLLLEGRSIQRQGDREAALQPSDLVLIDSREPFVIDYDIPFRQLMLSFPRHQLLSRLPRADALTATRLEGARGVNAVAGAVIRSLYAERNHLGDAAASLVEHALDVVAVALGATPSAALVERNKLTRIHAFIEENLFDPALSPRHVAHHLGVSVRYLHRTFEGSGETLSQHIWRRRLERARAALIDPRRGAKSITEIAFATGFNDASHFSKAFVRAFGESPTEWRGRDKAVARTR